MKPFNYQKLSEKIELLSAEYRALKSGQFDSNNVLTDMSEDELEQPRSLPRLDNIQILLAEDDKVNRNTLVRTLTNYGCSVTAVENGREALDEFENKSFDLILTDLTMPVMDGLEAARNIRQRDTKVPIVLITALAITEKQEEAYAIGMNGFVTKPIDYEELLITIQELTS